MVTEPWKEWRTPKQNDLLQPACRDLARSLLWESNGQLTHLTADEFRWLVCADILGQKAVRGIHGGVVLLGGSSRKLRKDDAGQAITLAFSIGDCPWDYGCPNQERVEWSDIIKTARGIRSDEDELARRFKT